MDSQLTWTSETGARRVLDSAIVAASEYYAAVEHISPDGARNVWCAVFKLRFCPKARDGYTFGYKDMDETMGPYCYRAPLRILDLLTETENARAVQWRADCRAYHAARKAKPALVDGLTIEVDNAPTFNGAKLDRVRVVRGGYGNKRLYFMHPTIGLFRWPSIRRYNYRAAA
ncbi:MAG: hypothetical protein EBT71_04850 [Alphaproteobacteria bacterium]|nr:hypothetical protein [Alphaproteobacteria bacterium]